MNTVKKYFSFIALGVFIFIGSYSPSFALGETLNVSSVQSCVSLIFATNPPTPNECSPQLSVDLPYILISGTGFTGQTKISIAGKQYPTEYLIKSSQLVLKMPAELRDEEGPVDVLAKDNSNQTSPYSADIVCINEGCTPVTTPTPLASTTPKPSGASPSPTGSGSATPPTQPIETDLRGECQKQGLQYDNASGLCLPTNPYKASADSLAGQTTLGGLIRRVLNILLTLAGVVAVLMIILGGYQYVTSRGAEDQAKAGRKTITYAAIGLIAVLLAYMLVTVVTNFATQGVLFN